LSEDDFLATPCMLQTYVTGPYCICKHVICKAHISKHQLRNEDAYEQQRKTPNGFTQCLVIYRNLCLSLVWVVYYHLRKLCKVYCCIMLVFPQHVPRRPKNYITNLVKMPFSQCRCNGVIWHFH